MQPAASTPTMQAASRMQCVFRTFARRLSSSPVPAPTQNSLMLAGLRESVCSASKRSAELHQSQAIAGAAAGWQERDGLRLGGFSRRAEQPDYVSLVKSSQTPVAASNSQFNSEVNPGEQRGNRDNPRNWGPAGSHNRKEASGSWPAVSSAHQRNATPTHKSGSTGWPERQTRPFSTNKAPGSGTSTEGPAPYSRAQRRQGSSRGAGAAAASRPDRGSAPSLSNSSGTSSALRLAAAAAAAASLGAQQATADHSAGGSSNLSPASGASEVAPTFVPRNPGIRDGVWGKQDAAIADLAQRDALAAVTKDNDKQGLVLLGKTLPELEALAVSHGQPKFRGKQLMDGILKGAKSIDEIAVIPSEWRTRLKAEGIRTGRSILQTTVVASDGTRKLLLQLADGRVVETVGIPLDGEDDRRLTVCVSSQVGCPMRCTFCATGKGGFARNLLPHEIVDQAMTVQEQFGKRVRNIVFMGMGEPLLNLQSVKRAYEMLNKDMGIGGRFITISTVGVPNAIKRLGNMVDVKATLAVSLHAPSQQLRETIVPSARAYPLHALLQECRLYYELTRRRVTFEYTLLADVNDSDKHAQELVDLLHSNDLLSHVNIIPWNPVDDSTFSRPSNNRVHAFRRILDEAGIPASVRATRGLEAAAACGQLRNQHQKSPMAEFAVPS